MTALADRCEGAARESRRGTRRRMILAAVAVVGCAVWAWAPLGPVSVPRAAAPSPVREAAAPGTAALDVDAFRAPLWIAPPPSPPPDPPPAPPPPLRLQLLAVVVHQDGEFKALLYDPDADRLRLLGPGEAIAGRVVEAVTMTEVSIRDDAGLRTLALSDARPGRAP